MKNGKIRFLSGEDLEKTLPMAEAIRAVKDAFLQLSNGQAIVPLRTPMALTDRDGGALFLIMDGRDAVMRKPRRKQP